MSSRYIIYEIIKNCGVSLMFWDSLKEGVLKQEVRVVRAAKKNIRDIVCQITFYAYCFCSANII